jgi:hypothetical protein
MLGKRIINTATGAGAACTTDTVQILGDTSCVAYYKMSDATDETGSYDGTPTNVNFNVAGKFGNAGEFNGSSSYVSASNMLDTSSAFSYSLWIKPDTISSLDFLIGLQQAGSPYAGISLLGSGSNKLFLSISGGTAQDMTPTLTLGSWSHIVLTHDGSGNYTCYTNNNGSPITYSGATSNNSSNPFRIGFSSVSGWGYFDGSIDQVRIFDRAITSDEVETLYNEVYCQPTIVPTDHFEPVLYTGNGSTQSISTLDFAPDFTWIKSRSDAYGHILNDSVRGANRFLYSNTTEAEDVRTNSDFSSFNSDGFTLGTNYVALNGLNKTFVAWNWKAGGAAVTNTDGTITSQVSANVDAGFSIVTTTTNASGYLDFGHGLGIEPNVVIFKDRENTDAWYVYHSANTANPRDVSLILNTSAANYTAGGANKFEPSTDVFHSGTATWSYFPNHNFIAYCFAEVDGFSKFGSYVGTGASGNSIVTGFRPAFVMTKKTDLDSNWIMYDNKRVSGSSEYILNANLSNADSTLGDFISFTSNGFVMQDGFSSRNANGSTYIFMAFAEEVFVPDNFFNDDSTVATYKLDGNAGDDSGNGNNGTAPNVTYAAGEFDEAAVFNGSSSYVDLGSTSLGGTNNITISAWIKPSSTQMAYATIIDSNHQDLGGFVIQQNNTSTNQFVFGLKYSLPGSFHVSSSFSLTANTWNHLAFVIDSSGNYSAYVNGSVAFTGTGFTGLNTTTAKLVKIGRNAESAARYFNGSIDQVRIFNRALDSGEVTQLYNE